MMLTPVSVAKSASDQSRDSRSARMAAPADSRLIAASGHKAGFYTAGATVLWIYVFIAFTLRAQSISVYAFAYVSLDEETARWHTLALTTRNFGSATPTTTTETAPRRHALTSGRPPRLGSPAAAMTVSYAQQAVGGDWFAGTLD